MTRRERHVRIIENLPHEKACLRRVLAKFGMDAFTDEAIEMLAAEMVSLRRFQEDINRKKSRGNGCKSRGSMTNPSVKTDDEKSMLQNWRLEAIPHGYKDGTSSRWAVIADTEDGTKILLADWLTKDIAQLIAAAPDMLEALKTVQAWLLSTKPMPEASKEIWNSVFVDANNVVAAAIAKATQR